MVEYEETPFGTVIHGMKDLLLPKCESCEALRAERDALKAELAAISQAQREACKQEDDGK